MKTLRVLHLIALLGSMAAFASAQAQTAAVQAEASTASVACNGGPASIGGNRNTIRFTGSCSALQIRGEANIVTASLAAGALIDIEGNGNHVRYASPAGATAPRLRVSGSFTAVMPEPGAPAPAADTASLSGNDLALELDCAGKSVTLQGTRSTYRLRGACAAITVRGEANTVHAELAAGAQLLVEGNGISLTYTMPNGGAAPSSSVRGMGSSVQREGSRAVALASPALPSGISASVPVLMHDLDAVVTKPGTLVRLPAAVFNGTALTAAGETQLARLASLIAQINPTGLRLTGRGADANAGLQRAGMVRGWLAAHGAGQLSAKTGSGPGPTGVDVLMLR